MLTELNLPPHTASVKKIIYLYTHNCKVIKHLCEL